MSDTLAAQPASYIEAPAPSQELRPISSVPWIAIALAAHVLFLVIAWFIVPLIPAELKHDVVALATDTQPIPPEPQMQALTQTPWPDPAVEVKDPTPDPRMDEAEDESAEDPTDSPNQSLAELNDSDSDVDSPHPNKSPSSAVGLGGGVGGGKGRGGFGGKFRKRPRGPGGRPEDPHLDAALEWLRDHQNIEGFWSATRFSEDSARKNARKTYNLEFRMPGSAKGDIGWSGSVDIGLTGMALLAFLAVGEDHRDGKYRDTVRRGLQYLRKVQYNDGCFGPKDEDCFVYNHSIAMMAMSEAYWLTNDKALKANAEKAVEFAVNAQNPDMGWRYGVQPIENDTSVTGWMVLALKSARTAGIEFDVQRVYGNASKWLDAVTVDSGGYSKTGYDKPGTDNARLRECQEYHCNASLDAINVMTRLFMSEWDLNHKVVRAQAQECANNPPVWDHLKIDYYYWYYASLALYQVDGAPWKKWEGPLVKTLFNNQRGWRKEDAGTTRESLDEYGSWDAVDAWSPAGGRVYATAINSLTLAVWTRYEKMQKK